MYLNKFNDFFFSERYNIKDWIILSVRKFKEIKKVKMKDEYGNFQLIY